MPRRYAVEADTVMPLSGQGRGEGGPAALRGSCTAIAKDRHGTERKVAGRSRFPLDGDSPLVDDGSVAAGAAVAEGAPRCNRAVAAANEKWILASISSTVMTTDLARTIAEAYRWQRRLGNTQIAAAHCHIVVDQAHPDVWDSNHADEVTAPLAQPASTATVTWTVEAVNEMVTVPAGTFSCLRVHSVDAGLGGYDSTFWFARNIGKVKESGTEVRELLGYLIP